MAEELPDLQALLQIVQKFVDLSRLRLATQHGVGQVADGPEGG
jgi:hypothetical protein